MYFIYVNNDIEAIDLLKNVLYNVDRNKNLIAVSNGFDLITFLQNVGSGEPYPDLIILTTKHLRISGKEVLELLKTDDIYRMIPVIMLLAEKNKTDEAFCKKLGTDFMITPRLQKDWVRTVKKMCSVCS